MRLQVGQRRRFHNDGDAPGAPHVVTHVNTVAIHYTYDDGYQAHWATDGDDVGGGYEECTEVIP